VEKDDGCTRILRFRTYLLLIFASFNYGKNSLKFSCLFTTQVPRRWSDISYPFCLIFGECVKLNILGVGTRQMWHVSEVRQLDKRTHGLNPEGLMHSSRRSYTNQDSFLVIIILSFHFISFHFISFHFISFHFISFHFISFPKVFCCYEWLSLQRRLLPSVTLVTYQWTSQSFLQKYLQYIYTHFSHYTTHSKEFLFVLATVDTPGHVVRLSK
jgi:hypothetical protein